MKPNIDVSHLEISTVPYDFRRDIFWFFQYCQKNEIKRTVYGNNLQKGEYKRIAKYLGHPELMDDYEKDIGVWWIDYIDTQALKLKWIDYDTEGVYMGYTSSNPSFQDNYIDTNDSTFRKFISLSALEQEKYLLRHYSDFYGNRNNLMTRSVFGRLDHFGYWGAGTGVIPTLNFKKSKSLLTKVLNDLTPNTWYAVSDLIEYMKQHHPWFLIPKEVFILENAGWKKPKKRVKYDRYYNFQEGKEHYGSLADSHIADDDPLGFEKVEGRFIERFMEDYIFSLGYADLAYSKEPYKGNGPEMGTLQAFRLSPTFIQVLNNQPIPVKVSVQPNFEIYIDAPAYPIATLRALKPFTNVVKEDRQIILKLEKQHVLSYLIENPDFNINGFLNALSDTPIPQNIITEIREWSERTDVFTLYEQFGIYESRKKQAAADIHTELNITPSICLVNRPIVLYDKLRKQRAIPLCVVHPDKNFQLLPQKAKTVFLTRKVVKWKKVVKKKVQIERKELVTYTVSNQALYDALLLAVLKARFSVEADKKKRSLTFLKREEAQIKTLLNDMKDNYQIKIKKIL